MLKDAFQRRINYLRISVTDKCNLRCTYCRPAEGVELMGHKDILSLEEMYEVASYAVGFGIEKIRLTGGEPLVKKNIEFLVDRIGALEGLRDFGMTTNGTMLKERAKELKASGLHRVNISLDTLKEERYREITRGGDLMDALEGIRAAKDAGLTPIKINAVIIPGVNEDERESFLEFGDENDIEVRFIRRMDLGRGERYGIESDTTVGQCDLCNRLRLTCTGDLKPCLFSEYNANVREHGIERAFELALQNKPESGGTNQKEFMHQIGG
jgi:cyclic pyranopterin phosphate synthase